MAVDDFYNYKEIFNPSSANMGHFGLQTKFLSVISRKQKQVAVWLLLLKSLVISKDSVKSVEH